jgi:cyclopropane-fatty-acyl-phospholipid synthase
MRQTAARRLALAMLRRISVGQLTIREGDRTTVVGPGGTPSATIEIHSPRFWTMLLSGGRGLADAYRAGLWDSPDIAGLFRVGARDVTKLDALRRRIAFARTPWLHARAGFARNTPERSRKDISAHYDLGNQLFELMLDPTMMYSCGVFEGRESTLHEASLRKLEMVCEKLGLTSGDHVVEIGTGWGGFAVYAATTRGCRVTTTTISREQHDLALRRVREAGVEHLVDVRLDDYRDVRGSYDKLVSLEMIEAVGHKDFGTFFGVCSRLLAPHGTMLLQAITIDDRAYDIEKVSRSFIRTYVFPNGCLPSQQVIAESVATRTDMRAVHLEDLTHHYAETLRRWRANFDEAGVRLEELGYDERFRRLWRMYLAYCEAGFAERRLGLVQMVLAKPQHSTDRLGLGLALAAGELPAAGGATAVAAG